MKYLLMILSFFILSPAYAIKCEWWQTKYSAASIDKHPRQGIKGVQEHPRKEYCRDKWRDAGIHAKQFRDEPIVGWPHKEEVFKKWNRAEFRLCLKFCPSFQFGQKLKTISSTEQ